MVAIEAVKFSANDETLVSVAVTVAPCVNIDIDIDMKRFFEHVQSMAKFDSRHEVASFLSRLTIVRRDVKNTNELFDRLVAKQNELAQVLFFDIFLSRYRVPLPSGMC